MKFVPVLFFLSLILLFIFSFGFIDPNLTLSANPFFKSMQHPLSVLVFGYRPITGVIFGILVACLFGSYIIMYRNAARFFPDRKRFFAFLTGTAAVLVLSFPALTYDIFNYITTAKVAFYHRENPYVIMPVDIPNEPYLAFTRAANKVALYGPAWILLTSVPFFLGAGNLWLTIIAFKLMNAVAYLLTAYLILRVTKSVKNAVFFALNPLVLVETLVSGHNDIYMMLFAVAGLLLIRKNGFRERLAGIVAISASVLVKGATLILLPVLLLKTLPWERVLIYSYWALSAVFFILTPIREELYPWYAVWIVTVAAFLPLSRFRRIAGFTIVLSFALETRHIPYMVTGTYGPPGPVLRTLLTVVPVAAYVLWIRLKSRRI